MRPYVERGKRPEDRFQIYEIRVSVEFARKVYKELLKDVPHFRNYR